MKATSLITAVGLAAAAATLAPSAMADVVFTDFDFSHFSLPAAGNPSQAAFGEQIIGDNTSIKNSFTWSWNVPAGTGGLPTALTATGTFTINSWNQTTNDLNITIALNNTTTLTGGLIDARIVSLGIGVGPEVSFPEATATRVSGDVFTAIASGDPTFPNFSNLIDVCAISGSNCPGGSNDGLGAVGDTQGAVKGSTANAITLDITPTSGSFPDVLDLGYLPVKFQTTIGSFEVPGAPGTTTVPEPATLALFGAGLLGLGWAKRRKAA